MEKLELYEGRPADCTGRLEKEVRTYDLLDRLGIQFWRTDHAWMHADTMEACKDIDAVLGAMVCKNLFLCNRQKTNFYLLMMPGDKPFKTKELSGQLGIARLSFASPEDMEKYLDCTPGSSSIMGLANDTENHVQLLMDEDLKAGEYLGCHPCINTSELSGQLGIARLSFASPEDMEKYLDCTPGSSSIMGLANDTENHVQLLMDEDLKAGEYLGCHPCINTSSLKLRTADVFEKFLPAVHHEPIFVHLTGE